VRLDDAPPSPSSRPTVHIADHAHLPTRMLTTLPPPWRNQRFLRHGLVVKEDALQIDGHDLCLHSAP